MNQGAFQFAKLHVDRMLENLDFEEQEMQYIGRRSVHSICTGSGVDYKHQTDNLWNEVENNIL